MSAKNRNYNIEEDGSSSDEEYNNNIIAQSMSLGAGYLEQTQNNMSKKVDANKNDRFVRNHISSFETYL